MSMNMSKLSQEVLQRTKSPTFLILFNNIAPFALFKYTKLLALVSMVTPSTRAGLRDS